MSCNYFSLFFDLHKYTKKETILIGIVYAINEFRDQFIFVSSFLSSIITLRIFVPYAFPTYSSTEIIEPSDLLINSTEII